MTVTTIDIIEAWEAFDGDNVDAFYAEWDAKLAPTPVPAKKTRQAGARSASGPVWDTGNERLDAWLAAHHDPKYRQKPVRFKAMTPPKLSSAAARKIADEWAQAVHEAERRRAVEVAA